MLTRHQVELIEIPQRMGAVRKNAADIKMAVDAVELSLRTRLHHHVRARHRRQRLHAARPQVARAEPARDRHRRRGVDVGVAARRVRRVPLLRAARRRRTRPPPGQAHRRAGSARGQAAGEGDRGRTRTGRARPRTPTSTRWSPARSPGSSAAAAVRCWRRCSSAPSCARSRRSAKPTTASAPSASCCATWPTAGWWRCSRGARRVIPRSHWRRSAATRMPPSRSSARRSSSWRQEVAAAPLRAQDAGPQAAARLQREAVRLRRVPAVRQGGPEPRFRGDGARLRRRRLHRPTGSNHPGRLNRAV